MPIASKTQYPDNWAEIAYAVKQKAGWKCERCKHVNDGSTGHVLTVHHLDGDKSNCEDWNLAALCQRCHLYMQPVDMSQNLFGFVTVSEWFRPHLIGYRLAKGIENDGNLGIDPPASDGNAGDLQAELCKSEDPPKSDGGD